MSFRPEYQPGLTLPPDEAAALAAEYGPASVILEYGAGNSTLLASSLPGKRVYTVENDLAHLERLQEWFALNPPASMPVMHHADIGATRKWGYPTDDRTFRQWPDYVQGVWDRPDFVQPDVVFIDGRFRLACLLTAALRTMRPLTALVDDYTDRPAYHEAQPVLGPPTIIGRMARFDIKPGQFPMNRLQLVIDSHMRPL